MKVTIIDACRMAVFAVSLWVSLPNANAQIMIGVTTGITGPVAASVKETLDGARLLIDSVNAAGGIRGEKIQLVIKDDKFDPKLAGENASDLLSQDKVVALFMSRGTPHVQAILPVLQQHGASLVAPSTGAMLLHRPVNPLVFNVRASYQREAQKAIAHLHVLGIERIGVIHPDDSFGQDALQGANQGFLEGKFTPVSVHTVDRLKPDYSAAIAQLMREKAQAVLWIGSAGGVASGIGAFRKAGSAAQVITLSNNASGGFIKLLGPHSRGVIVTQVFPNERMLGTPIVRELKALAKAQGFNDITPAMMEGFAGAKVLIEGLKRAGAKPSRESLLAALDKLTNFDLGGIEVSYSPADHTGLDFAEMSIIGSDGRFWR